MPTVQSKSHVWEITIELDDVMRLKSEGVMDLTSLDERSLTTEFNKINSLFGFGAIFATVCTRQIQERNLTHDQFFADFTAEQIHEAREKIMDAIVDFFQRAGGDQEAMLLGKGIQTYRAAKDRYREKLMAADMVPRLMQDLDERIEQTLSGSAGRSADDSGSTPGAGPSGN